MPTHISVWGYMYPLVFPFGGTCSFLRVHIFFELFFHSKRIEAMKSDHLDVYNSDIIML